jgi:uncharacterized protein YjbI with pentapeptide repeats
MKMTQEELNQELELHRKWLSNDPEGIRLDLYRANLSEANLSGANLSEANLYGANLSEANLYGANLSGANLSEANLYGANLSEANLYGANLYGANLSEANLSGANLSGANLSGANLSGANLSRANLSRANLSRANLSEANLYIACSSQVQGIDIQVIYLSKHRIVKYQDTIQIGCKVYSIQHWLDSYREIGKKAGYTEKEIKQYGNMIKLLAHSSFQ